MVFLLRQQKEEVESVWKEKNNQKQKGPTEWGIIYLEPHDLYFWRSTPPKKNKAFSNQNKGHLGSRYRL